MFHKNIIKTLFISFFFVTVSAGEADSEGMSEKIKGKIPI